RQFRPYCSEPGQSRSIQYQPLDLHIDIPGRAARRVVPSGAVVLHVAVRRCSARNRMVHLPAGNYFMSAGLTVGAYWPLSLLLVIPYVWWIRRRTWMDATVGAVYDRARCMLGVVRSAIIALLALSL